MITSKMFLSAITPPAKLSLPEIAKLDGDAVLTSTDKCKEISKLVGKIAQQHKEILLEKTIEEPDKKTGISEPTEPRKDTPATEKTAEPTNPSVTQKTNVQKILEPEHSPSLETSQENPSPVKKEETTKVPEPEKNSEPVRRSFDKHSVRNDESRRTAPVRSPHFREQQPSMSDMMKMMSAMMEQHSALMEQHSALMSEHEALMDVVQQQGKLLNQVLEIHVEQRMEQEHNEPIVKKLESLKEQIAQLSENMPSEIKQTFQEAKDSEIYNLTLFSIEN